MCYRSIIFISSAIARENAGCHTLLFWEIISFKAFNVLLSLLRFSPYKCAFPSFRVILFFFLFTFTCTWYMFRRNKNVILAINVANELAKNGKYKGTVWAIVFCNFVKLCCLSQCFFSVKSFFLIYKICFHVFFFFTCKLHVPRFD